jgi:hypothetical protein
MELFIGRHRIKTRKRVAKMDKENENGKEG